VVSLLELEKRIAIIRDNIRQLVEQAAAFSGAEDEARNADRIAQQTEELESGQATRCAAKEINDPTRFAREPE
jgi:hypothetical protein